MAWMVTTEAGTKARYLSPSFMVLGETRRNVNGICDMAAWKIGKG
jgi:hypothetical protein